MISLGCPEDAAEIESEKFNEAMFNTNLRLPKRERQPGAGSESLADGRTTGGRGSLGDDYGWG